MGLESLFYTRECLGKEGKTIRVTKIRTMKNGSSIELTHHAQNNGRDMHGKVNNDPRVTKVGKFLRKYWIDEWPQIFNLIKGEMKLVGIRSMDEEEWKTYPMDVKERALNQKPGLVGFYYCLREGTFEDHIAAYRNYLDEYDKSPLATDLKYLFAVAENVIFNGVRSS
jgi:lipopolysaccharide/colanic/teichoic acid biosynthesis glycosyltransferase